MNRNSVSSEHIDKRAVPALTLSYTPIPWWIAIAHCLNQGGIAFGEFNDDEKGFLASQPKPFLLFPVDRITEADVRAELVRAKVVIFNLPEMELRDAASLAHQYIKNQQHFFVRCRKYRQSNRVDESSLIHKLRGILPPLKTQFEKVHDQSIRAYATSYEGVIHESFHHPNYRANKDTFRVRQRLRELLIRMNRGDVISSEILIFQNTSNSFFRLIENEAAEYAKDPVVLTSVLYKYGKCVLQLQTENTHETIIVVVTLSDESYRQRLNEKRMINSLIENRSFSSLVKNPVELRIVADLPCFIMKASDGVSIDLHVSDIDKYLERAAKLLHTLEPFRPSSEISIVELRSWLEEKKEKIRASLPSYIPAIESVIENIIQQRTRYPIKQCLMHGDYKLENVMFDEEANIRGIIDWELAEKQGFPFIDLFYLLAYFAWTTKAEVFEDHFGRLIDGKLDDIENSLIREYETRLEFEEGEYRRYLAIYFIHHFSERYHIHEATTNQLELFTKPLEKLLGAGCDRVKRVTQ